MMPAPFSRPSRLAALAVLFLFLAVGCGGGDSLPSRTGRINDYSGSLDKGTVAALEESLQRYESETCHQFVVIVLPSLEGRRIEALSSRIMAEWKIGHGQLENGLLLTVSLEEGKTRIDTGKGLEFIMSVGRAEDILLNTMIPLFRDGRIDEGVTRGVEALMEEGRKVNFPPELRPEVCRGTG